MSTHTRLLVAVMSIVLVMTSTVAAAKPTRAECIIGYKLDWSEVKNPTEVRDAIIRLAKAEQLLAWATYTPDWSEFYMQYKERCDNKREMAEEMIRSLQVQGFASPRMDRIPDPIKISSSTIDLPGPEWSDPHSPISEVPGRYPAVEVATGLYQLCNRSDDGSKAVCSGYISGVFEVAANNPVDGITSCLRKFRNVSAIRTLTLKWIAAHPEKAQEPASTAIAEAMAEVFPCQKVK